ncbi:MAG: alpha/beta hydrolase [Dehalococcoidia bacterium]|nr:alpha/beta hydrolase [Dehalococcoidia bacterium]
MEPREGYVDGNGLRLRYLEWCPEQARTRAAPLVCLHGIGGSAEDWQGLAAALGGGRRVIALDARGHGASEWSSDAAYSTDAHFADLACAVDALGLERFLLAGYSMGGGVAILSANALRERVAGVVVVDAYPGPEMTEGSRRIAGFIARGPWLHEGKPRFDPAISAAFARDLEAGEPRRMDLWPHWDALDCPTLLVRGELSRVLPASTALEMQARLPAATTRTIEGATHNLIFGHAEPVAAALGTFLERCDE